MTLEHTAPDVAVPEVVEKPHTVVDPDRERSDRERRARRRRKRLMLWGIPFALAALLVAAKLISMVLVGQATVGAYQKQDYEGALNSAQQQKILNVIEQWKAPYDTGTSYLQLGLNDEARVELESALGLAVGADQCPIRANLAIAIERQGDALLQGDRAGAEALWREALEVLALQPQECPDSSSGPAMEETKLRLEAKLDPPPATAPDPSGTPPPEQQEQEQDLEDQLEDNQQDREDLLDEDGSGGGSDTDKPW